ncbi:MAG: hypothetical protein QOK42_529 [Frankiaceae bacterium]|nr:hypothetical protein [Frankiaceae bacterium]
MSAHLGPRLSAFIDGELSHADRDRVLAHLTHCAECRGVVEAERQVKSRLSGLGQPEPPATLLAKLHGLPAPTGGGMATRPSAAARRPDTLGGRRRPRRSPRPLGGHRLRRAAVGASAVVAVALSAAFAVGGADQGGTTVRPQVDQFTVEHASVSGTVPLVDPASLVGGSTP